MCQIKGRAWRKRWRKQNAAARTGSLPKLLITLDAVDTCEWWLLWVPSVRPMLATFCFYFSGVETASSTLFRGRYSMSLLERSLFYFMENWLSDSLLVLCRRLFLSLLSRPTDDDYRKEIKNLCQCTRAWVTRGTTSSDVWQCPNFAHKTPEVIKALDKNVSLSPLTQFNAEPRGSASGKFL